MHQFDRQELSRNGRLSHSQQGSPQFKLCPSAEFQALLFRQLGIGKANTFMENLRVLPLTNAPEPEFTLKIYNILHQISTMTGLEYYSTTRKRRQVLFKSSTLVAGPKSRTLMLDPDITTLASPGLYYAMQDDTTFGKINYQLDYTVFPKGGIHLRIQNLDQMWYGILPLISPRALDLHFYVERKDDFLFFYTLAATTIPRFLGVEYNAQQSFQNRLLAMENWLLQRLQQ
jgi:hypothetical protein